MKPNMTKVQAFARAIDISDRLLYAPAPIPKNGNTCELCGWKIDDGKHRCQTCQNKQRKIVASCVTQRRSFTLA